MRFSCLHTKQLDNIIEHKSNPGWRLPRSGTHKKGKTICFGLLLPLFIMLGLSLSVCLDVNALSYDVDTFQFWGYSGTSNYPNTWSPPFSMKFVLSDDINRDFVYSQNVVSASLNSSSQCEAQSFSSRPSFYSSDDRLTLFYGFSGQFSSYELSNPCMTVDSLPSVSGSFAHIVPADHVLSVHNNLPYRFSSSGIYRTNTATIDGIVQSKKFDLIDILGANNYPSSLYSMELPLIPSPSVAESLVPGIPIELKGEFIIDMDDPSIPSGLDSSASSISLKTFYSSKTSSGTSSSSDTSSCSISFGLDDPSDVTGVYSLKYSCTTSLRASNSYNPSIQIPSFLLDIDFSYSSSNTKFSQFIFDSSFVITNNDNTPGGSFGTITGGDLTHAPGSVYNNPYNPDSGDDSNVDWFASLSNLFNFSFINPFAPIFGLFNDSTTCASIPTIAGMIHSNETQVCPFFSSQTRQIVTPVIGLSSMMLLFGFVVRWLGARSGNFFEDSGSIESPGTGRSGDQLVKHGWRRK